MKLRYNIVYYFLDSSSLIISLYGYCWIISWERFDDAIYIYIYTLFVLHLCNTAFQNDHFIILYDIIPFSQ